MPTSESERVPGRRPARFAVVDPATGETFDEAPDQQPDELDAVVDRAHRAWHGWRADPVVRTTALRVAANAVEAASDDLARLFTREQGEPLAESHAEVARTAARLRYFADLAPRTRRISDGRPVHSEIRWRSLGPVAAIVPWNFPLQLAAAKFAPALVAGNTVVLKPVNSAGTTSTRIGRGTRWKHGWGRTRIGG
jgi:acyl-CoA reductase-like NAD-dependent aldehyde dehydrogenase